MEWNFNQIIYNMIYYKIQLKFQKLKSTEELEYWIQLI